MQILSVTLINFKTHRDRHFRFQPGTNAICGENGAGKTSILEAIAWVLFNYTGDYTKTDLIRNGSGSAQVSVTFVSSYDGRTYDIQRCTHKGYTLFDPQLNQRLPYSRIQDEVMPWLRDHMGVAPGTDLGRLFANTVGVPQGTFTADFLLGPEKRKPIFDTILKVEEYRQANQKMLSLEKYAKAQSERLQDRIAQYDEALKNWDELQQRRQAVCHDMEQQTETLKHLQQTLQDLQQQRDRGLAQARQLQTLTAQLQTLTAQIQTQEQANLRLEQSVAQAQSAVQRCEAHHLDHQAYLAAEQALQELEQQNSARLALWRQREAQQKTLGDRQTALTRLMLQLESLGQAEADLQALQTAVQQQEALERQHSEVGEQLQKLQTLKLEQRTIQHRITQLERQQATLAQEIQHLQSLKADVAQIPAWEKQRDRLQEQLSRIEAAKQFEAELRQLVHQAKTQQTDYQTQARVAYRTLQELRANGGLAIAPADAVLDVIRQGVTLNQDVLAALDQILMDLSEQVSRERLQHQLQQIRTQLQTADQQRLQLAVLDTKLAQQAELSHELTQRRQQITTFEEQLQAEAQYRQQQADLVAQLQALHNPKGRSQLLQQQLQQQAKLRHDYETLQTAQTELQKRLTELDQQLDAFADLDDRTEAQKAQRQNHQAGYLIYLQHEKLARDLPTLKAEMEQAIAQLETLQTQYSTLQTEQDHLLQTFDPEQLQQLEATYSATKSQADQISGALPQQHKLLQELDQQIATLQESAQKRSQAQTELKDRDRVRRFITYARKVYKQAGPRITEMYVQTISREADRLFRELINRPNVALEWTRDYDILVQEGPHNRRFINLSGGEQMCAALAVRLALLKVLADLDIAFFDEPTTNMDQPRRESLAEAIARIKSFQQLFVISHDDTFEKVTENVILVEREA